MKIGGAVYILTNTYNTVLYTGVTSDLYKRIIQHKNKEFKGFTSKYGVNKLVYYETYLTITEAIAVEKRIKAGNRTNKVNLIESINPEWKDLFDSNIE